MNMCMKNKVNMFPKAKQVQLEIFLFKAGPSILSQQKKQIHLCCTTAVQYCRIYYWFATAII